MELEGEGCDITGVPGATPTMRSLWDAYIYVLTGEAQEDGHTRASNEDALMTDRCGYGRELWVNRFQLVQERWVALVKGV